MSIAINSNFERDQYEAVAGQTVFQYSFPIFSETYIKVYQRAGNAMPNDFADILTLGVDYSVQGTGEEAGGTITLTVPAAAGDIVTVVGQEPIERESVFQDLNPFTVALNQQFNEQTVMQQQTYTYWNHVTPRYYFSELVSNEVRPLKRYLPMLPDNHVWVGRGEIGDDPDDIVTAFFGSAGTGNVTASGPGMRPSITQWTGMDFVITDSDLHIVGYFIDRTAGSAGDRTGWADVWGAMHWPAHVTGGRPVAPADGDTYYDTTLNQFFGYLSGAWVPFATGSGSNSLIERIITQVGHGLVVGNYVRITSPGGLYVTALANNAVNAELAGLVVAVQDADHFTLRIVGFVDTGVFAGLTPGAVYFLSDLVAGAHTLNPPVIPGTVNLPVFIAETATQGWLRHSRGIIVAGTPQLTPGDGNTHTVIQPSHGFDVGDWLYIIGETTYALGDATAFASSQVVGVVIQVIDINTFVIQQSGFNVGAVTQDDLGNPIVASTVYYLSATVPGQLTGIIPSTVGLFSKPLYVSETVASDSGWILDQRPLGATNGGGGDIEDVDYVNCLDQDTIPLPAGVWTDIPCMVATISPESAASLIQILATMNLDRANVNAVYWRLTRDGTPIGIGGGGGVQCYGRVPVREFVDAYLYVDAPATTNPTTYQFQVMSPAGNTFYLNTDAITAFSGASTMILQDFIP